MKAKDVETYEQVRSRIVALQAEFATLAKSRPDNPINRFKVNLINARLAQANGLLTGKFKPWADFDLFDADSLPSNSDVMLILSQYLDALEGWRCAHVRGRSDDGFIEEWYWDVEGEEEIGAEVPTRFSRKE